MKTPAATAARISSFDEVKASIEEFDLVEVARIFGGLRQKLATASGTEKFLLLVEAAAAVGLLE